MKEANTAIQESSADQPSLQVLTFLLDHEIYGTDISQIQEVLEYIKVTPVPRTPDFMLGVINLRGHECFPQSLWRHRLSGRPQLKTQKG